MSEVVVVRENKERETDDHRFDQYSPPSLSLRYVAIFIIPICVPLVNYTSQRAQQWVQSGKLTS